MQLAILTMCFSVQGLPCTLLYSSQPLPFSRCEHYAAQAQFIHKRKRIRITCKPLNYTILFRRNYYEI